MSRTPTTVAVPLMLLAAQLGAGWARAEADLGDAVLEDVVEVVVIDRDVTAFDAEGSGRIRLRLDEGETVYWTGARGRVGVAITSKRLLGVAPGTSSWREAPLRLAESVPERAWIGGRVALVLTGQRALAFDSRNGRWVENGIGPGETLVAIRVGQSTGLVVTNRRALGFSANAGKFFEIPLRIHERLEDFSAGSQVATITTSQRVLVFRSPTGAWGVTQRDINP